MQRPGTWCTGLACAPQECLCLTPGPCSGHCPGSSDASWPMTPVLFLGTCVYPQHRRAHIISMSSDQLKKARETGHRPGCLGSLASSPGGLQPLAISCPWRPASPGGRPCVAELASPDCATDLPSLGTLASPAVTGTSLPAPKWQAPKCEGGGHCACHWGAEKVGWPRPDGLAPQAWDRTRAS